MENKLPSNVVNFAAGHQSTLDLIKMFTDYWNHSTKKEGHYDVNFSLAEKEEKLNAALKKEIIWRANVPYAVDQPVETWFFNRNIASEAFAVVGMLIDVILPESIIETIGIYSDIRVIGWGDSASFDVEPRDLFTVSKAGHAQKTSEVKKQFRGQVTVVPEMREITVGVSLYRVLSGKESLAAFVAKAVRSMETQLTVDVYNLFATTMSNLDSTATTGLQVSGYTEDSLIRLCEQVGAWNMGAKPIVMGTSIALLNVLPDDANYRYTLDDKYTVLGYIPTIAGYDVMRLPQVAKIGTPFDRVLDDTKLWIVSPGSQKLIKVVLEGSALSNTTQNFENSDLTQTSTLWKSYGYAVCTNSVAGLIAL